MQNLTRKRSSRVKNVMKRFSLILSCSVAILNGVGSKNSFAQSVDQQQHVEEMEAQCGATLFHDGRQGHEASYSYKAIVSRFIAVTASNGQWCVDANDFEFKSGYGQFYDNSDVMKRTIDDYNDQCRQMARNSGGQQCQQRQQWFSYAPERAYGVYACAPDFVELAKRVFPRDQCSIFKLGEKNPYRFK
jgi:hypothetical protein